MDVTDPDAVDRAADAILAKFGGVDILVNNAGYAANIKAEDYPDDEYYRLMRINLDGVMFCCRAFGRHMLGARQRQHCQCRLHVRLDRE